MNISCNEKLIVNTLKGVINILNLDLQFQKKIDFTKTFLSKTINDKIQYKFIKVFPISEKSEYIYVTALKQELNDIMELVNEENLFFRLDLKINRIWGDSPGHRKNISFVLPFGDETFITVEN